MNSLICIIPLADIADVAYHATLPVGISVFSGVISYGLLVRNSMIAVTGEDYILTARALIAGAELIICDEPTSALDVSVHSQICNLLLDLRDEFELTYLFISHNLSLVKHITDHMAVMYLGEVMESGATAEIFAHPAVPYTRALMLAIPEVHPTGERERIILSGEARSPIDPPDRCRFVSRCPNACEICRTAPLPPMVRVGNDHIARCHLMGTSHK